MSGAKPFSRLLSGNKVIWLLAAVAVVFLTAGIVIARFIESPADAAAKTAPPEAGLITVPVENRVIANDVVLRADVLYDESVAVTIDTTDISGTPVVTGQVPEVGTTVNPASVVLEVAGRPVIALPGELPAYRTLRVGVSGPDVLQLKQALAALGINPGNAESDVYDAATVAAVDQLYVAAGYPAPAPSAEDASALQGARDNLRSAKDMLSEAEAALTTAAAGPTQSERMTAQSAVNAAQRELNAKIAERDTPPAPAEDGTVDTTSTPQSRQDAVDTAQEALDIAIAARDEAGATTGTSSAATARDNARASVEQAQADLDTALESTMTALPAAEVVYFSNLPRRVDQVQTSRGTTLSGSTPFMSVSGATVVVEGSVAASDAALLEVGMAGTFPLPDGAGTVTGTISEIVAATSGGTEGSEGEGSTDDKATSRFTVTFVPEGLTEEQTTVLLGQNIKITVPVSSTGDEVLAVPAAALTAGSGGESRVERAADDGTTELLTVETGLAAQGYVEIVSSQEPLAVTDKVVVGK